MAAIGEERVIGKRERSEQNFTFCPLRLLPKKEAGTKAYALTLLLFV